MQEPARTTSYTLKQPRQSPSMRVALLDREVVSMDNGTLLGAKSAEICIFSTQQCATLGFAVRKSCGILKTSALFLHSDNLLVHIVHARYTVGADHVHQERNLNHLVCKGGA